MRDQTGRYGAYTRRLVDSVFGTPGQTPSQLRRAVAARAAGWSSPPGPLSPSLRSGEAVPERSSPPVPLSGTERGIGGEDVPAALARYVDLVACHAYKVADDDIATLQRAGHSDDAVFEVTVAAALGAALGRLERGLAALRGEDQ
jgi:alkylhydroperoxidase family enzyme